MADDTSLFRTGRLVSDVLEASGCGRRRRIQYMKMKV